MKVKKTEVFKKLRESVGEKNLRAWERKQNTFIKILAEIQPIEDQIIDALSTKNELIKRVIQLREEIIPQCPHPDEMVVELNNDIKRCKFCDKDFKEFPSQRRKKLEKFYELKRLVEHVNNIENVVLKRLAEKQPLVDRLTELRNEMVQICVHPKEYVTIKSHTDKQVIFKCGFCNKDVLIVLDQGNNNDEKTKKKQSINILGSQYLRNE